MSRHKKIFILIITLICTGFCSVYPSDNTVTNAIASDPATISQDTTPTGFYNILGKDDLGPKLRLLLFDEATYSRYQEQSKDTPTQSETDTNKYIIGRNDKRKDNHQFSTDFIPLANILFGVSYFFVNTVIESIFVPDEPSKTTHDENDEWFDRYDGYKYDVQYRQ